MANVAKPETEQISKTQLILSLLAEQGPKTEYDLYKQLPKLSHGTIHFCLNKLAHDGAITYAQKKHGKGQAKKLYYLTFIGTVTHIGSYLYWQTMELTDSQIDERWKQFEQNEQDELIEFLCRQGKLLKYVLFEESKWLKERYSGIASIFAIIAHTICIDPPQPYRNLLVVAAFASAKRRPSQLLDEKAVEAEMPSKKELLELLQDAYRREFTRFFFELIVFIRHNNKATTNLRLRRLVEEALEEKRHETVGLELAEKLFSKQAK
jgi:DNA-binding PadR family transcriptional regulator